MKQQELLRKQADMMDMAEKYGLAWGSLVRVRLVSSRDAWQPLNPPVLGIDRCEEYQFALGVVEGKPVFEGDTLYARGMRHVIVEATDGGDILQFNDSSGSTWSSYISNWSWLPPKPKTVMVELPFEVIENAARWEPCHGWAHAAIGEACRKALEDMKC